MCVDKSALCSIYNKRNPVLNIQQSGTSIETSTQSAYANLCSRSKTAGENFIRMFVLGRACKRLLWLLRQAFLNNTNINLCNFYLTVYRCIVSADLCRESRIIQHSLLSNPILIKEFHPKWMLCIDDSKNVANNYLDDACNKRRTVQLSQILWYTDEPVHQKLQHRNEQLSERTVKTGKWCITKKAPSLVLYTGIPQTHTQTPRRRHPPRDHLWCTHHRNIFPASQLLFQKDTATRSIE